MPSVQVFVCVSHTLVHYIKSENSAVVAILLFRVPGKTGVLSPVLKGDVPQQDGDVVALGGADKLHTLVIHVDIGLHTFHGNHRFTQLHTHTHTHTQICTLDTQR